MRRRLALLALGLAASAALALAGNGMAVAESPLTPNARADFLCC